MQGMVALRLRRVVKGRVRRSMVKSFAVVFVGSWMGYLVS